METREYQEQIIQNVLSTTDDVLVVSPTGSGKTYIAKRIAEGLQDRVIFITPRIDLVTQTVAAFDYNCDVLWKDYIDTNKHITVASRQTLQRRDISLKSFVAIFDEAHVGLQSTKDLITKFKFKRVIGLTATPERQDGYSLIKKEAVEDTNPPEGCTNPDRFEYGAFDRVLETVTLQDLQKQGYLADLVYSQDPSMLKVTTVKSSFDELRYSQFGSLVNKVNVLQFLTAQKERKPYLVFTPDVYSAEEWCNYLNNYGFKFKVVSAKTKKEERDAIYESVKNGDLDGLVNCSLLTYGFDMPEAKAIVLIRNIRSRPLLIQIVGRVLRPYKGTTAHVYDAGGSIYNFSTAKHPMLFKHPIKYKYTGEWRFGKKSDTLEDIAAIVGEHNVQAYIDDPISTLLSILNEYKLDYEQIIYNSEVARKQKEQAEKAVAKMDSRVEYLEQQVKEAQKDSTNPYRWFKSTEPFTWFKYNLPPILREVKYDKSKIYDKELLLTEIYPRIAKALPIEVDKNNVAFVLNKIQDYSGWWLRHFTLDYKK